MIEIIAEVGSNYDDELDIALAYVKAAKETGADVIKFQTLRRDKIDPNCKSLELPDKWHYILKAAADEVGIEFMSTPFYLEAVDLLEDVGVKRYKVSSSDIIYYPLLDRIKETGKPVILSTGASSMLDIQKALEHLGDDVTLLHCVSKYPPNAEDMNLLAIETLKHFGKSVGLSDHSMNYMPAYMAVALGAEIIEKHITFYSKKESPDRSFAMPFVAFKDFVKGIRLAEKMLGDGVKMPLDTEPNIRRDPKTWLRKGDVV